MKKNLNFTKIANFGKLFVNAYQKVLFLKNVFSILIVSSRPKIWEKKFAKIRKYEDGREYLEKKTLSSFEKAIYKIRKAEKGRW